jgi:hypothetical protein
MKITQLVLLQNLKDELILPDKGCDIPAPVGDLLTHGEDNKPTLDESNHTKYQNGVRKLMHLVGW